MKKLFFFIFAVLGTMTAMAQNDGSACEKAIYVDSTLMQSVEANTVYWFTANTGDLPLTVYFFPEEKSELRPEVYVDFTCEPGVYEDEKIRDIVDLAISLGIYFPLGAAFDTITIEGNEAYMVSYDRKMLELLVELGIDYSVPAYVMFRSPVAGTAQMSNVKGMTLCTDIHQRVEIPDTLFLQANKPGLFYFPVNEWKDNKISFTWTGEKPIRAYLETDCEFDTVTSEYTYTFANQINGFYTQQIVETDIDNYIRDVDDDNMYALFMAQEDGKVYVKDYVDHGTVTINSCIKNLKSTAIEFPTTNVDMAAQVPSKSYRIEANKLQDKNIRLKWKTTENKLAVAYFANFCGFELKAADPDVVDTIHFAFNEEEQAMIADIPRERVNNIVKQNTEGWLFMQIYRQEAGTFSWDTYEIVYPDCDNKSLPLLPNDSVSMPAEHYHTSYKIVPSDWLEYRHSLTWHGTRQAYVFVADSCDFPLAPYNIHVGKYYVLNPGDSVLMSVEDIDYLATEFVDEYNNIYVRVRSTAPGSLVVRQLPKETGLFDNAIISGKNAQLVIINQSLYIQISDPNTVEYYDLMGRKVEFNE